MSRKPRADSRLKSLPEERQQAIIEHMREHKLAETRAWLRDDGLVTSAASLSDFWSWWHLRDQFARLEKDTDTFVEMLKEDMPELSEEKLVDYGNRFFQLNAIKAGDAETYLALQTAKHKGRVDTRKLEIAEEKLKLDRAKFQRETSELFLKFFADETARRIAESTLPKSEKVEQLGQRMFGELWNVFPNQ